MKFFQTLVKRFQKVSYIIIKHAYFHIVMFVFKRYKDNISNT